MSAWHLVYEGYRPEQEGLREVLCALGNGYVVSRAAAPDVTAGEVHYPGTYLAGCYNRLVSQVAGREIENEDLVNLPNWLPLSICIDDGPWLGPDRVQFHDYRQELDLRQGLLRRSLRFEVDDGRMTRWEELRLVSMADRHLAGIEIELTAENWSGRLGVRAAIDGSVGNAGVARYRALNGRHLETLSARRDGDCLVLASRTRQSRREVAVACRSRLFRDDKPTDQPRSTHVSPDMVAERIDIRVERGTRVRVEKIAALYNTRDVAISEPVGAAWQRAHDADGFDALLGQHAQHWRQLWDACDVEIDGADGPEVQMKLRLHIFHLLQTASPNTVGLDAGVPPRGWHGEAYRGHVMWDELFILPFLNLRLPSVIRSLLGYRAQRLDAARWLARDAGARGAMYPWQSGSSGREESQIIHLNPDSGRWIPDNSNKQRHVNGAVAYNVWQYFQVTDDRDFLYFVGAEVLFEIARFWASLAELDSQSGRYSIRGVMGPDEFHTRYPEADPANEGGINDNTYTNVLAAWVLTRALDVMDMLPPQRRAALSASLQIKRPEVERWDRISRNLRLCFLDDGIPEQFDGYGDLAEFDWARYRERYGDLQRLDRILEAEGDDTNRYKLSKQADVLMLFYLFSADELQEILERLGYVLGVDTIPRTIDYYLARTTHGSTLSWVVHAWVLSRARRPRAWDLFCAALNSDFVDMQGGTTPEGIHLGAMAGTVDMVQRCFTGLELRANVLHFNPRLPSDLARLRTRVRYRRQQLDVEINQERLGLRSGQFSAMPITVAYRGQVRELSPGQACSFRLIVPPARMAEPSCPAVMKHRAGA